MTVDDLRKIYDDAFTPIVTSATCADSEFANVIAEAERAGIVAVVKAMRDECDRLKAALEPFAKLETYRGAHDPAEGTMRMRVVTVPEIEAARKALEDAAGDGR